MASEQNPGIHASSAENEKKAVALNSVLAALLLTVLKVVVGLLSGSLGILAEAAHSGLDLLAACFTYLAVRVSGKPADREHPYGHGKIENLSALAETFLLLLTCGWISYEAIHRLTTTHADIDASIWAFGIMIISIVVDVSRSRMLRKAAIKHRSQALEADALHFTTDIWSSSVVIIGLIGVKIADWHPQWGFLNKTDALAALLVAGIAIIISVRLAMRTVHDLLDSAPTGMAEQVKQVVEAVPGIGDCHAVRIRTSGPRYFVDLHITVDGSQKLADVHALADQVELAVQNILPDADVTVHPEPIAPAASEVRADQA